MKAEKGKITSLIFRMAAQSIEGQEVIVTAQARGQNAAINEQLGAPSIANVIFGLKDE